MRELNKIVFGKGLFAEIKGKLSLTKGRLVNQDGQFEIEYYLIGNCF